MKFLSKICTCSLDMYRVSMLRRPQKKGRKSFRPLSASLWPALFSEVLPGTGMQGEAPSSWLHPQRPYPLTRRDGGENGEVEHGQMDAHHEYARLHERGTLRGYADAGRSRGDVHAGDDAGNGKEEQEEGTSSRG